jgi:hypothetical protein
LDERAGLLGQSGRKGQARRAGSADGQTHAVQERLRARHIGLAANELDQRQVPEIELPRRLDVTLIGHELEQPREGTGAMLDATATQPSAPLTKLSKPRKPPNTHGLYGLPLMEGLKSELKLYDATSVASLGWEAVAFKAPILAGDELRGRFRFEEKRPTRNPARGFVVESLELLNARDEAVTTARHTSLILTRHSACSGNPGQL